MLDFSVFDSRTPANEGAWLHLTVPGTKDKAYLDHTVKNPKKPVRLKLVGAKSDKYREWMQQLRRNMRADDEMTREAADLEDAQMLARLTIGWENVVDDGEPLEFTPENAEKLYFKYNEIRVQAFNFFMDSGNFMPRSVKS